MTSGKKLNKIRGFKIEKRGGGVVSRTGKDESLDDKVGPPSVKKTQSSRDSRHGGVEEQS